MTRLRCLGLCACLGLSLTTMACGSGGAAKPWDQGRIANTGTEWWVNATKGAYFFSMLFGPSYATDTAGLPNTAGQATVIAFTEDVIKKLTPATAAPASLMPAPNEVAGWIYDPNSPDSVTAPAVANNADQANNLLDGSAAPIFPNPPRSYVPVSLAWEVYGNTSTNPYQTIDAKIVQLPSSANAGQFYTDLLSEPQYSKDNNPWSECTGSDPNPCGP